MNTADIHIPKDAQRFATSINKISVDALKRWSNCSYFVHSDGDDETAVVFFRVQRNLALDGYLHSVDFKFLQNLKFGGSPEVVEVYLNRDGLSDDSYGEVSKFKIWSGTVSELFFGDVPEFVFNNFSNLVKAA